MTAERADQQLDGEKKLALRRNFFWRAFHADCVFRCGLLEPNRFDCLSRSRPEGHQKSQPLRHQEAHVLHGRLSFGISSNSVMVRELRKC